MGQVDNVIKEPDRQFHGLAKRIPIRVPGIVVDERGKVDRTEVARL